MVAGYIHEATITPQRPAEDPGRDGRAKIAPAIGRRVTGRIGSPSPSDLRFGDQLALQMDLVLRCERGAATRGDQVRISNVDPALDGTYTVVAIRPTPRDARVFLRRLQIEG